QAGNHRIARGIDDRAGVQRVAVRADAPDPRAVDGDVDVGLRCVAAAVPALPGVNRLRAGRRRGRRPGEPRIDGLHDAAGCDVDDLQPIAGLIQDPLRVAGPG